MVAHQVYALDAASGGKLWEFATGGFVDSSPAVVGGMVFVGSDDNKVRAADPPGRLTTAGVRTCMRLEKLQDLPSQHSQPAPPSVGGLGTSVERVAHRGYLR